MIPRMTTIGVLNNYRYDLNKSNNTMNKAMNTVLTGRSFSSYGEDPALATRCFQIRRSFLRTASQLEVNTSMVSKYGQAWSCLDTVSQDIYDSTVTQNSTAFGSLLRSENDPDASGRNALGQSLSALAKSIVQTMNGRNGENYIFGGADTLNAPFTWGPGVNRANPDYIDLEEAQAKVDEIYNAWLAGGGDPDNIDPDNPPPSLSDYGEYASAFKYLTPAGKPTNDKNEAAFTRAANEYKDAFDKIDYTDDSKFKIMEQLQKEHPEWGQLDGQYLTKDSKQLHYFFTDENGNERDIIYYTNTTDDETEALKDEDGGNVSNEYKDVFKVFEYKGADAMAQLQGEHPEWGKLNGKYLTANSELRSYCYADDNGVWHDIVFYTNTTDVADKARKDYEENPAYNEMYQYEYLKSDGTGSHEKYDETEQGLYFRGVPVDSDSPLDREKMEYFLRETKYMDVGLGHKEEYSDPLSSTVFNSALQGIYYLGGYGTKTMEVTSPRSGETVEVEVPNNLISIINELGAILQRCDPDNGSYASDEDAAKAYALAQQFEDQKSIFTQRYAEEDTRTSFLRDNGELLTDTADSLSQQFLALEDVDPAAAISAYMFARYCYDAALKLGNSVLPPSLMDYMSM